MSNQMKRIWVPKEYENFLKMVENNLRKQINAPPELINKLPLKSEIHKRIPIIFNENPNLLKMLIQWNKGKKRNKNDY